MYVLKYNPKRSAICLREQKRIIIDTMDEEAFEINYRSFDKSHVRWFPEALMFKSAFVKIDYCLAFGDVKLTKNNIGYIVFNNDLVKVNTKLSLYFHSNAWEDGDNDNEYLIQLLTMYCKDLLCKIDISYQKFIEHVNDFCDRVSCSLQLCSGSFRTQFFNMIMPDILMERTYLISLVDEEYDETKEGVTTNLEYLWHMHKDNLITIGNQHTFFYPEDKEGKPFITIRISTCDITEWYMKITSHHTGYVDSIKMFSYGQDLIGSLVYLGEEFVKKHWNTLYKRSKKEQDYIVLSYLDEHM